MALKSSVIRVVFIHSFIHLFIQETLYDCISTVHPSLPIDYLTTTWGSEGALQVFRVGPGGHDVSDGGHLQ